MRLTALSASVAIAAALAACAEDDLPRGVEWGGAVDDVVVEEAVPTRLAGADVRYGLPRADQPSIADVLAIFPSGSIGRDERNTFAAPGLTVSTDQCQGGGLVATDALPVTIEAVVTLQPSKYLKLPICGQDERFYGAYVIEDDTGGIVVLRDSRVAFARPGDRVRIEISAISQFYGSPDQRAVVVSSAEVVSRASDPVIVTPAPTPFASDMVARTHRIDGFVVQAPTDENFNAMIVADALLPTPDPSASSTPVCRETCAGSCRRTCPSDDNLVCTRTICPVLCANDAEWDATRLPQACWSVAIEAELGRRGFGPEYGQRIAVTAPVVGGFGGLQMWIVRLGQVEFPAN